VTSLRLLPYGPGCLFIQFAEAVGATAAGRGRQLTAELEQRPPPGLIECVPGFTTLLLEFRDRNAAEAARASPDFLPRLEHAVAMEATIPEPAIKEIPVAYDGVDLERVARHNGLSVAEVIELHSAPVYRVYLLGFSPGFPYLGDLSPRLHTPRLTSPRTRVEAGSVAIGGEHTGIYSVTGPGGWNVIGHTSVKLFDPERTTGADEGSMFHLHPGDRVKFIARQRA
jgi:KipI family sensor histidine kinase inhibitor